MLKGFPMPPGGWKAVFKLEINSKDPNVFYLPSTPGGSAPGGIQCRWYRMPGEIFDTGTGGN